jgi:Tfp pilus assembly protein PilO
VTARRLFLYLLGGGGLFLVLSLVVMLWLWGQVQETSDKLLTARASESQLRSRLASLEQLERDYTKLSPRLSKLDQALPAPITPELVVTSIRSAASASGVAVGSFDFKAGRPVAGSIPYSLKVSGSYGAVRAFLARTAVMTPLTDVTSMNINKPVKEADQIEASLQMVSHGGR